MSHKSQKTDDQPDLQLFHEMVEGTLFLKGSLVIPTLDDALPEILNVLQSCHHRSVIIDLDGLSIIDSAGVAALDYLKSTMRDRQVVVTMQGGSPAIRSIIKTFAGGDAAPPAVPEIPGILESLGEKTYHFFTITLRDFLMLTADICFWAVVDLFGARERRKGEFTNQAVLIGVNALPIVGIMAFLIGLVLALQSAAQLRQFGANIFIVDLTVIAMMREMGPLITAIIVAGRSGSAIASEIATMKVTEELDALTTMALNPTRFIMVPKLQASIFTLPFLTVLATMMGIGGGIMVAYFYLDISPAIFFSRMGEALFFRDMVTGFIKSLVFAGLIVITACFFGIRVREGAEGVGRVTTASVVAAISLVILADSVLGLMFY